jgi:RNA-directed DNA polymerase
VHAASSLFAVPLAIGIHEGLVWSNRDRRTLLDKMLALLGIVAIAEPFYFVADGRRYLDASPSKKSIQRLKRRVGDILGPGNQAPWPEVRGQLNSLLRGWSSYFSYRTRLMAYRTAGSHVYHSVRRFLRRRRKVQSQGMRRFSDEVVFDGFGVLRLRRVHLGPMPTAAR